MLQLDLQPSRYLLGILLLTHVAAMLVLLHLPIPWWAILLIAVCMAGSLIHCVRHYVSRQHHTAIIKIWRDTQQQWHVLLRNDKQYQVKLQGDSVSTQMMVILNFRFPGNAPKKQSVLIFNDAVTASDFRRLRKSLAMIKR